ncbi:hypothetical protein ACSBR2_037655 [Camellia fascicularis]
MVGQAGIVKELITIDPKLRLLKGREKTTPLHCAAMAGHTDVINLLLDGCPQSLVELTIWNETALHLAVKSNQLEAFKLLFEWLQKLQDIEIIKILLSKNPAPGTQLDVNVVSGNNQTGLYILFQLQRETDVKEIETILCQAGAVTAGQIITPPPSTAAMTPPKTFELKGHPPPINSNNIMIIASILLAITCFLTGVYPPGGV